MLIDLAERSDLVWGVDRVERDGGATAFLRMPRPLQEHYADAEARRIRMRCTTGVRIVLRTDAESLRLSLEYGEASRKLYQVDVAVDGELLDPVGSVSEPRALTEEPIRLGKTSAMRTVTIWLTHCVESGVRALEVDDVCTVAAAARPDKTWLAIGDSITQGMTCQTPARTYAARLARTAGLGLRNVGVGGGRMDAPLGALCRPIPADVATVAFGANDFNGGVGVEAFAANARSVLDGLLAGRPDFPVGLITPTPWLGRPEADERGETLEDYRGALRALARDYPSVRVIEGADLVPDEAECFVDGVHPNDRGMAHYADGLAGPMASLLAG